MKQGWQKGGFKYLLRNITKANTKVIEVGVTKSEIHRVDRKHTVAKIYFWNDQGTKRAPPRPTLRPSVSKFKRYRPHSKNIMRGLTQRQSSEINFSSLGLDLSKEVKKSIMKLKTPPLRPRTISNRRYRGNSGDNPLVDTQQLIKAINFRVR